MVRIGIVGCGPIARVHHAPALAALPDVEIVAVCDVDAAKAEELGQRYQAAVYSDIGQMLDRETLDAVDIVTSEGPRPGLLKICIERGKHVFTEKPLAGAAGQYLIRPSDVPQLHPIIDAWQANGTQFGINFNLRQSENMRQMKAAVDAGELGEPEMIVADTHIGSTNHILDQLRWLNGDIIEVSAVHRGDGRDPSRCAVLKFENGSIGMFSTTFQTDLYFRIQYYGTRARAIASDICGTYEVRPRDGVESWNVEWSRVWRPKPTSAQTYSSLFAQSVAQFIESVKGNGSPAATGLDGLRHMEIDAAITQSFETGQPVAVNRYQVN